MCTIKKTVYLVTIMAFMLSCINHSNSYTYYNIPFETMKAEAKKLSTPFFCVVLIDKSSDIEKFQRKIIGKGCEKAALWNYCNRKNSTNYWYTFLLGNSKTPMTIIFNNDGQIKNIVYGFSIYAQQSIFATINKKKSCTNYLNFGYSYYGGQINDINDYLSKMIYLKYRIEKDDKSKMNLHKDQINNILCGFQHPFGLYLKLRCIQALEQKDSITLILDKIKELYKNQTMVNIYGAAFMDSCAYIANKPKEVLEIKITMDKDTYHIGEIAHIEIEINNKSDTSIYFERIEPSCQCIIAQSNHSMEIAPYGNTSYHFIMNLEETGKLYREISFYSQESISVYVAEFQINVEQ